jgi:hypothetical protein
MKPLQRAWGTNETLGLVSIIDVLENGAWNVDQDLKGRWHTWQAPATEPDHSDHVARHLQADFV